MTQVVQPVRRAAATLNGITIAYMMGLVNALLALSVSFGVHLTDQQTAAMSALVNVCLVLAVHVSHRVGETTATGTSSIVSRIQTGQAIEHAERAEVANTPQAVVHATAEEITPPGVTG